MFHPFSILQRDITRVLQTCTRKFGLAILTDKEYSQEMLTTVIFLSNIYCHVFVNNLKSFQKNYSNVRKVKKILRKSWKTTVFCGIPSKKTFVSILFFIGLHFDAKFLVKGERNSGQLLPHKSVPSSGEVEDKKNKSTKKPKSTIWEKILLNGRRREDQSL